MDQIVKYEILDKYEEIHDIEWMWEWYVDGYHVYDDVANLKCIENCISK